jgi:hypothetical protein
VTEVVSRNCLNSVTVARISVHIYVHECAMMRTYVSVLNDDASEYHCMGICNGQLGRSLVYASQQ